MEQRSLSFFVERIFLVIPLSRPYFPSTRHHASNLGLKCVNVLMQNTIISSVCIPCSPCEQKPFSLINDYSQPWSCLWLIQGQQTKEAFLNEVAFSVIAYSISVI